MERVDPPFTPTKKGRNVYPLLTTQINRIFSHPTSPPRSLQKAEEMDDNPSFAGNGLSPISETDSPTRRDRKMSLLSNLAKFRRGQPGRSAECPADGPLGDPFDKVVEKPVDQPVDNQYYFGHVWTFWHDKHVASGDYEGRLTPMQEDIMTVKLFWEVINAFPLKKLGLRDSVHFFKRGVKPVWEDPRNVSGGAWIFRVPKEKTDEFWREVLVLAVGEHFYDVLQQGEKRDDICGLSLSIRFNGNLISIWHRDASNEKSKAGIRDVILDKISPKIKPTQNSHIYYKQHSTNPGFDEAMAKIRDADKAKNASTSSPSQGSTTGAVVNSRECREGLRKDEQDAKGKHALSPLSREIERDDAMDLK